MVYLIETYNNIAENHGDPRTKDWPMMYSPIPTLLLVTGYIILTNLLSSYMKNKNPRKLQKCTFGMNAFQFALCTWLLYNATGLIYKFDFNPETTHKDTDPETLMILNISWYFYISRFLDFASTIILILRKQNDKVTFVHIFYNSVVPIILWTGLKFIPSNHSTIGTYMNMIVLTLIYFQNMFSALKPHYETYMNWKINPAIFLMYFVTLFLQALKTFLSASNESASFGILVTIQNLLLFYIFYMDEMALMIEMYGLDNMKEVIKKISKLGEMCIPNQENLYSNADETSQKNE